MDLNQLVSKNQSIKIVPSVEETLRTMGLNVDLDVNSKYWFDQLKTTWKTWKKSTEIESRIEVFFRSIPDPYRVALVFVIKCDESKDCKPKSLPYFVIETLQKYAQKNETAPEESLKLPAFRIAIQQRNQHFLNLVVKTYQTSTIKHIILPMVKDMICNDNCKQASQIVVAMELFDDIPVEDLLFPLILQDKSNMIDEYLSECPSQVEPLLLFLDGLLDKKVSIREYVQKYIEDNKINHVKYAKIHHKPLGKLVARLCNKFNIPIEKCKNLSKNRTSGGLRYLIRQRYLEHNVSSSVWDDLVRDSLRQNAESGQEFIDMLIDYDRAEALKWAEYLNVPENKLPVALQNLSLENTVEETENWDTEVTNQLEYYKFSLSSDQIIMIDNGEKFYDLISSTLKSCNIASIDCEWKPSFGAVQSQVALVQIATSRNVYLIDSLLLNKQEYTSFWYNFYKSFLDNAEIIKLGFGLEQDLKEMKNSILGLGNIKVKGEGLLDLSLLWKSLLGNGLILPTNSDTSGNSLSSLVQSCFGLPLEKSEQCSNWELRPLRNTQILYASLDAHVLIELYYLLQNLCLQQGIMFEEICNDVMLESKKKITKKPKIVEKLQPFMPDAPTKSVYDIKFTVENNLSNLVPYLRYCGINSTIVSQSMLWHDIIKMAISEDRYVLLAKLKFTPTANFSQSSILDVGISSTKEQLHKVLHHFNINIKQDNLLTYCLRCNNNKDLQKIYPSDMYKFEVNGSCVHTERDTRYVTDDYEDVYDNFLSDSDGDDDLYHMQPVKTSEPRSFKTSKGVSIEVNDIYQLSLTKKPVILCETCGKLFWEGDELTRSINDVVLKVTNLSIW